jgi:hypothetical protein
MDVEGSDRGKENELEVSADKTEYMVMSGEQYA